MPIDLSNTIQAKSDQLNADDLIGTSRVLKITDVKATGGDQPVSIYYDGDNKKPYKPSKGMRRLLIAVWGSDGAQYLGKSLKVYCDPTVTWGGMEVGGIRISHMSHIDAPKVIALTLARGRKVAYKVEPLIEKTIEQRRTDCIEALKEKGIEVSAEDLELIERAEDREELGKIYKRLTNAS